MREKIIDAIFDSWCEDGLHYGIDLMTGRIFDGY